MSILSYDNVCVKCNCDRCYEYILKLSETLHLQLFRVVNCSAYV